MHRVAIVVIGVYLFETYDSVFFFSGNVHDVAAEQMVECSTTVNCSSNGTSMSARECCVNSVDGLSYSIPGQQQCHTCIGMSGISMMLHVYAQ